MCLVIFLALCTFGLSCVDSAEGQSNRSSKQASAATPLSEQLTMKADANKEQSGDSTHNNPADMTEQGIYEMSALRQKAILAQYNTIAKETLRSAWETIKGNKQCYGPCNSIIAFHASDTIPNTSFSFPAKDTVLEYSFKCCYCTGNVVGWARGAWYGKSIAWKITESGEIIKAQK